MGRSSRLGRMSRDTRPGFVGRVSQISLKTLIAKLQIPKKFGTLFPDRKKTAPLVPDGKVYIFKPKWDDRPNHRLDTY